MKNFWNAFARYAAQVAIWAAEHPQVVQAVVDAAKH